MTAPPLLAVATDKGLVAVQDDGSVTDLISAIHERATKQRHGKGCWYLRTIIECPVCMSHEEYVERQYSPRPESIADRIVYRSVYDGCQP